MKKEKIKFDIMSHELVPKHEVLSREEAGKLLKRYNITGKQLPKIKVNDPVVKALKAKPGDIVKITRKSYTLGETIYYRYVIHGD